MHGHMSHNHPQNRWSGYSEAERPRRDEYRKDYDDYDGYDRYQDEYNCREFPPDRRCPDHRGNWQHQPPPQQHNRRPSAGNYEKETRGIARIQISQPEPRSNSHLDDRYDDCEDDYDRRLQHPTARQPDALDHRADRRQMERQPTSNASPAASGGQWRNVQNHNSNRTKDQVAQSTSQNGAGKEPHLRFEHSSAPFHGHNKHDIIDGFQSKQKFEDDKSNTNKPITKKNEIPPAPPGPAASIKNIINNLKGNSEFQKNRGSDDRKDIPKNKVSTNPFLKNGDNNGLRFNRNPSPHEEMVRNVQEVVQKMNSGEWPIKIDDENNQNYRHVQRPPDAAHLRNDKAKQWETLDRRSPNMRNTERGANSRIPKEINEKKKFANACDSDHYSERSDQAENTTVSTDSAMGSDESISLNKIALPFEITHQTGQRKMPSNVRELNDEAEKLLIYFKTHRNVLNYLGIGLSETLWNHVHALPNCGSEILVDNMPMEPKLPAPHPPPTIVKKMEPPQITVTRAAMSPNKKVEHQPRSKSPQKPSARFNQSPRMTALERELCTDTVENGYQNPNENACNKGNTQDNRGGRFVKKSAAALIAKKQGIPQSLSGDEAPMSSDFADPRIAAEIQQLREREEELKRSRSELGLPSLDDVMDTWSGKSPIRLNSQNLDYLKQMDNTNQRPQITKSQSAHNIYIEENLSNHKPDSYFNFESRNEEVYEERGRQHSSKVEDGNGNARGRFQENRHEREEQFFREPQNRSHPFTAGSPAQLRAKCVVKGVDITVHSSARSSHTHQHSSRQIGL